MNAEKDNGATRTRKDFFYVPLPNVVGEEIDKLLDKYGGQLSLLSRNEFVRTAVREYIAKIRKEMGD